jgi:hypothetical protein
MRLIERGTVADDDGHSVMSGAGRDDEAGLRKCVAGLSAFLDEKTPLE